MSKPKVALVVGTRPDAIKTMPVVLALRQVPEIETVLISTGQHREMLDQVFATFEVQPQIELNLMKPGQSLAEMTGRMSLALGEAIESVKPQFLLAQGDTTTTFLAGLMAFYAQVPFGHIEAGLRTHNIHNPFPEEFNRQAVALFAEHHYAPTDWSAANLVREHVQESKIFVTGNTGIDAVKMVAAKREQTWLPDHEGRVLLMTMHRRENWGEPMRDVATNVRKLVDRYSDTRLVVAMHRNPIVREVLQAELGGHDRIELIEPPEYESFVKLMQRATLILSDSGGVQEEAPAFGIPVLVLRTTTERPEGVNAGCAKLVGTDGQTVFNEAVQLLENPEAYASMANVASPYGDGSAGARIVNHIREFLQV